MNELKLDNMQSMIAADEVSAISSALLSEIFHGFEEAILVAEKNQKYCMPMKMIFQNKVGIAIT